MTLPLRRCGFLIAVDSAKALGLPIAVLKFMSKETKNCSLVSANKLSKLQTLLGHFIKVMRQLRSF
jgi:hypothetical protein